MSKPVGTPGRYKDFLSADPEPEYPPEAAKWDKGVLGRWLGPEPKGFNFVTENDAGIADYIELYVGDCPARTQWANPSKYKPSVCWRIEVSPDFREYTLFFRKDAVWHPPVVDLAQVPAPRRTAPGHREGLQVHPRHHPQPPDRLRPDARVLHRRRGRDR